LAPIDAPTLAPYAASKGGVNQLVRTLAAEWAQHNIRVKATIGVEVTSFVNIVSASSLRRLADLLCTHLKSTAAPWL
jgi:NAD(P)-dependent dehydrogenase (short-subunit alcohol dehydrogenase family)